MKVRVRDLLNDDVANENYDISKCHFTFTKNSSSTENTMLGEVKFHPYPSAHQRQNTWEVVHSNFFIPDLSEPDGRRPRKGWTRSEHITFLMGMKLNGRGNWKDISKLLESKSPKQVQSHAQKYFLRQYKQNKNKRSIHDFNEEDLNELLNDVEYKQSIREREPELYKIIVQYLSIRTKEDPSEGTKELGSRKGAEETEDPSRTDASNIFV
ncbi:hypothetical protein AKO1_009703 [Acrasis kona]|uniref:Uncharacterized protein n=1 Tax=Acrasis kona TaxID=1008807 RepID=A0AAW2ZMM0_9EUKA